MDCQNLDESGRFLRHTLTKPPHHPWARLGEQSEIDHLTFSIANVKVIKIVWQFVLQMSNISNKTSGGNTRQWGQKKHWSQKALISESTDRTQFSHCKTCQAKQKDFYFVNQNYKVYYEIFWVKLSYCTGRSLKVAAFQEISHFKKLSMNYETRKNLETRNVCYNSTVFN